jgi:hypothetical protein
LVFETDNQIIPLQAGTLGRTLWKDIFNHEADTFRLPQLGRELRPGAAGYNAKIGLRLLRDSHGEVSEVCAPGDAAASGSRPGPNRVCAESPFIRASLAVATVSIGAAFAVARIAVSAEARTLRLTARPVPLGGRALAVSRAIGFVGGTVAVAPAGAALPERTLAFKPWAISFASGTVALRAGTVAFRAGMVAFRAWAVSIGAWAVCIARRALAGSMRSLISWARRRVRALAIVTGRAFSGLAGAPLWRAGRIRGWRVLGQSDAGADRRHEDETSRSMHIEFIGKRLERRRGLHEEPPGR